jgi:hypothetical protein
VFDGAVFQADYIPVGSTLTLHTTFLSGEYLEYIGSGFNDAVSVWLNGQKQQLTVGDRDVLIDTINPTANGNLYVDSANDIYNIPRDGFTVTLTLKAFVIPGQVNGIKIDIAGTPIQTGVIAEAHSFAVGLNSKTRVNLVANSTNSAGDYQDQRSSGHSGRPCHPELGAGDRGERRRHDHRRRRMERTSWRDQHFLQDDEPVRHDRCGFCHR